MDVNNLAVINTVKNGIDITKKGWFSQSVYAIIFSFFFGLIIVPFSFLVAIASVMRGDISNTSQGPVITNLNQFLDDFVKNPFFWASIYLLLLVGLTFVCILIGMLQFIGMKKYNTEPLSLEENLKYPFKNGRFIPFLLLAFLESIVIGIIGGLLTILRDALDLNKVITVNSISDVINNFFTWQNMVYLIVSLVVYLILIPPLLISCFAIIHDKAKFDAFIIGWKNYFKSFLVFEEVTFVSLIPMGVVVILFALIGLGIASVTGFETTTVTTTISASDLTIILSLSFIIVLLSFVLLLFLLPMFLNTVGKSYEDQKT